MTKIMNKMSKLEMITFRCKQNIQQPKISYSYKSEFS